MSDRALRGGGAEPAPTEGTQGVASPSGGVRVGRPSRAAGHTGLAERQVEAPRLAGGKTPEAILGVLDGVTFPAKKDTIIRAAAANGAPEDVLEALRLLTATEYASADHLLGDYPRLPDEDDV